VDSSLQDLCRPTGQIIIHLKEIGSSPSSPLVAHFSHFSLVLVHSSSQTMNWRMLTFVVRVFFFFLNHTLRRLTPSPFVKSFCPWQVQHIAAIPSGRQSSRSLFGEYDDTFKSMQNTGSQSSSLSNHAESSTGSHHTVEDAPEDVSSKTTSSSCTRMHEIIQSTNCCFSEKCVVGYEKKCTVCLKEMENISQDIKPFPSYKHRCHKACIQTWTEDYGYFTCPKCRVVDLTIDPRV
jgi:hypothetical protein